MLNDIKEWETCESHGPSGRPKKQATGRRTTAEVNHSSCQVTRSLYFTEVAIPQDKPIRHSFTEQTDPSSFHYLLSGREVSNRQIAVAGTGLTPFLKPSRPRRINYLGETITCLSSLNEKWVEIFPMVELGYCSFKVMEA